jgi:hypothetical protein
LSFNLTTYTSIIDLFNEMEQQPDPAARLAADHYLLLALQSSEHRFEALLSRALREIKSSNWAQACIDLSNALRLHPHHEKTQALLAKSISAIDPQAALEWIDVCLDDFPESKVLWPLYWTVVGTVVEQCAAQRAEPRFLQEALARLPEPMPLDRCGVVAAPCQAGRITTARSLAELRVGGAVTVSPHIVPQCSLHSVAGAVSVALGMHGPHLGVGGGPDALAEGLLAAATLLNHGDPECPAAWLVATEWDEEPALDPAGQPQGDPVCRALAVQLVPAGDSGDDGVQGPGLGLAVHPSARRESRPRLHEPAGGVVAFARALAICREGSALTAWAVDCPWGEIRLTAPPRGAACAREAA